MEKDLTIFESPRPQGDIDVTVTLISTNEKHYLDPMLPQLYESAGAKTIEVILVDNVSTDGTHLLEKDFPNLKIIRNSIRKTFPENHNLATRKARGRYILCLNPDVLFEETDPCLEKMVEFMDGCPECGISCCQVYHGDKSFAHPARRFQTLPIVLSRRFSKIYHSQNVLDRYFYIEHDKNSTFEAEWLSGCFLFMRREALMEVGLFDERFQKYFEEVDMCRRMAALDWKVLYYGGTRIYHMEQRASRKILSRDAWLHLKSWMRWKLRQKHYRSLEKNSKRMPKNP